MTMGFLVLIFLVLLVFAVHDSSVRAQKKKAEQERIETLGSLVSEVAELKRQFEDMGRRLEVIEGVLPEHRIAHNLEPDPTPSIELPMESPPEASLDRIDTSDSEPKKSEEPPTVDERKMGPSVWYESTRPAPSVDWGKIGAKIQDYAHRGILWLVIGVVVLVLGLSFLFQYTWAQTRVFQATGTAARTTVSVAENTAAKSYGATSTFVSALRRGFAKVETRLALVASIALGLLALGWKLRKKRHLHALILQGTGIGLFFMATFFASTISGLIPVIPAFGLIALTMACAGILALKQDSEALAWFAMAIGFAAPTLTGVEAASGALDHVRLFSYYSMLILGIFAVARFKSWRGLNLLGFIGAYVASVAWCVYDYPLGVVFRIEPFILLFFFGYTGLVTRQILRDDFSIDRTADAVLLVGTPVAFCSLQFPLVWFFEDLAAVTAYALGIFYVGLGYFVHYQLDRLNTRRSQTAEWDRRIVKASLIMGAFFGNLAMPLSLPLKAVMLIWGIGGALLALYGGRIGSLALQITGLFGLAVANLWAPLLMERLPCVSLFLAEGLLALAWGALKGNKVVFRVGGTVAVASFAALQYLLRWNEFYVLCLLAGTIVIFAGIKMRDAKVRIGGIVLQVAGTAFFFIDTNARFVLWSFGARTMGSLTACAAFSCLYAILHAARRNDIYRNDAETCFLFGWGVLWFYGVMTNWVFFSGVFALPFYVLLALFSLCGVFFLCIGRLIGTQAIRPQVLGARITFIQVTQIPAVFPSALALYLFASAIIEGNGPFPLTEFLHFPGGHPLAETGILAWPIFFLGQYVTLALKKKEAATKSWNSVLSCLYVENFILSAMIVMSELGYLFSWGFSEINLYWIDLLLVLFLVFIVNVAASGHGTMPSQENGSPARRSYGSSGCSALCILLCMWAVSSFLLAGDSSPLAYIPILNPLAFAEAVIFLTAARWYLRAARHSESEVWITPRVALTVCTVAMMAWSTVETARIFHFYGDTPFRFPALWGNLVFQTTITLLWGLWSLGMMRVGSREAKYRRIWTVGAILLSCNVLKLLFADLAGTGTLTRIFSFLGLGILLMLVGWLAPLRSDTEH
jgi:uncharacterized membrane protein